MSNHSPKLVKSEPTAPPTVRFAGNFGDEDSDEEPSPGNGVEKGEWKKGIVQGVIWVTKSYIGKSLLRLTV